MERQNHPVKEEIKKYIWEELKEDREIEIGEHLAVCKDCQKFSREEFKQKLLWEGWTAKMHGEVYWQKRINIALETALAGAQTKALKERLESWIKNWEGKVGAALEIILTGAKEAGKVITDLPQILLAAKSLRFAYAPVVRGEEDQGIIKIVAKEKPGLGIITDMKNRKVIVQIEKDREIPPLVILAPREGVPMVAEPKKVEGTLCYAATFDNIPEGEYTLIFEPEE